MKNSRWGLCKLSQKYVYILVFFAITSCLSNSLNEKRIKMELSLRSDSTFIIDPLSHVRKNYPLSQLIDSIRYVKLENSDKALIGIIQELRLTKHLLYVLDLQTGLLKCFDREGHFIRSVFRQGGGPEEISRLSAFDVDEQYVYLLDYAKNALQIVNHDGAFIIKKKMPFRALSFKKLPDGDFLFLLAPYTIENKSNANMIALTDSTFKIKKRFMDYIDGLSMGISFENRTSSPLMYLSFGNGIYELKRNAFVMKYYLNFDGHYFNSNKRKNGISEAVNEGLYMTSTAPLHNSKYMIQPFSAGNKRNGTLICRLNDNRYMFIENLKQDRDDVFQFSFNHLMGYDETTGEFYGICNYVNTSDIIAENRDQIISEIKERTPANVRPYLIQNEGCQLLLFYKLRNDIMF